MKLSEALRLGEFVLPPAHGHWFKWKNPVSHTGKICGACAVGRACYAAGYRPREGDPVEFYHLAQFIDETWPWTRSVSFENGILPCSVNGVLLHISDWYEKGGLSIAEIADRVEQLEQRYNKEYSNEKRPAQCTVPHTDRVRV